MFTLVDRGGEGKRAFEAFSCSVDPCVGVLNVRKVKKLPLVVQDKERMCEMHSFIQGPSSIPLFT